MEAKYKRDFDICLFVIGMEYCKHADVSLTIRYGSIILEKNEIIVELVGSLNAASIRNIIIPSSINKFNQNVFKVWIPYSLLNNENEINSYLDIIFKPIANSTGVPTISLSRKVFTVLTKTRKIFLDEYFSIQECVKFQIFRIENKKKYYEIGILLNGEETIKRRINIMLRDGKGNEDL